MRLCSRGRIRNHRVPAGKGYRGDVLFRHGELHIGGRARQDQGSPFDYIFNNTRFVAPVTHWTPDASTTVTFEAEPKNLSFGQNYGFFPYINGVPVSTNLSTNWGLKSPQNENSFLESLTWSHKFDSGWSIKQNVTIDTDYTTAAGYVPYYLSNGAPTVSGQGVGIFTNQLDNHDQQISTTVDVTGKASTGPIEHTLLLGGDYYHYNNVSNKSQAGLLNSNIHGSTCSTRTAAPQRRSRRG